MATTGLKILYPEEYLWAHQELRNVCGWSPSMATLAQVGCWAGVHTQELAPAASVAPRNVNCVFLMVTSLPT